ncbi:hypothetical protein MCHI_000557 [Candidatus Magnetoovum chiemensis]|nr:hypothetical protein MCHI_000557 [Candidatus Magnetoovum chiemensis]
MTVGIAVIFVQMDVDYWYLFIEAVNITQEIISRFMINVCMS